MLERHELFIGLRVEVSYNGSKYFTSGRWNNCGDFRGHVEAFGADWVVIRDSYGAPRSAVCEEFKYLEIEPYSED